MNFLSLKQGVKLKDLSPQMVLATMTIWQVYSMHLVDCVITSANDSSHMSNSKHYVGEALDFRTNTLSRPTFL